jgi:hypothetical protein
MAKVKKPAQPSKVVGEAIDWTDADLDKLAEITPEDVASAKATYRRLAPKKAKRLLDAKQADD